MRPFGLFFERFEVKSVLSDGHESVADARFVRHFGADALNLHDRDGRSEAAGVLASTTRIFDRLGDGFRAGCQVPHFAAGARIIFAIQQQAYARHGKGRRPVGGAVVPAVAQ